MEEYQKDYFIKVLQENSLQNGDCLEWTGKTTQGYGYLWAFKTSWAIHRVAFILKNGVIENGLYICHKCNNKKCINPDHLYSGTAKDNTQDYRNSNYYWDSIEKGKKTRKYNRDHKILPDAEFLTIEETAKALNVHKNTIYNAVRKGYLIGIRLGIGPRSPYRICRKSLDAIHSSIIMQLSKRKEI